MIRLRIVKSGSKYRRGDVIWVSKNEAHGLIDAGFAVKSKDMTESDYKTSKKKG